MESCKIRTMGPGPPTVNDSVGQASHGSGNAPAAMLGTSAPRPEPHRRLLSVRDVTAATGLGRTRVYEEFRNGLPSVRVGRRRLIRTEDLEAWLSRLPTA